MYVCVESWGGGFESSTLILFLLVCSLHVFVDVVVGVVDVDEGITYAP